MDIIAELTKIAKSNGGLLRPADVVDAAAAPEHPLHDRFTWDDSEAALQYRLWQARELIRVTVVMLPGKDRESIEVRAFVSLTPDRANDGGGYRSMSSVVKNVERRAVMLQDALDELRRIKVKYAALSELASVFAEIEKAINDRATA